MKNSALKANEELDIRDLAETDIIKMLMKSDRVGKDDLIRLCEEAKRELGQYHGSSVA